MHSSPQQEERNSAGHFQTVGPRDRYPRTTLIGKDGLLSSVGAGKSL